MQRGVRALLRVVYAYSVMAMRCCTAATCAAAPATSEAKVRNPDQVPGGGHSCAALEYRVECLWPPVVGERWNTPCLHKVDILVDY